MTLIFQCNNIPNFNTTMKCMIVEETTAISANKFPQWIFSIHNDIRVTQKYPMSSQMIEHAEVLQIALYHGVI